MVSRERKQGGGHAIEGFRPAGRHAADLAHTTTRLTICSPVLQDHPLVASPDFADWRLAATAAQNAALADSTRAKRNSSWNCYERFLSQVGVELDPFLVQFGRKERTETLACFAAALRDGRLRSRLPETAGHGSMSSTIRAALDGVAQTFRLNQFESPIHDAAGRLDPLLALQLKKYADDDPGPKPQQAVPLEVIRKVRSWSRNESDVAIGQLVVTAFFFAMRSCEYSDAGGRRLTSVIRVDDVRFRKQGETLSTKDQSQLQNADAVTTRSGCKKMETKERQ